MESVQLVHFNDLGLFWLRRGRLFLLLLAYPIGYRLGINKEQTSDGAKTQPFQVEPQSLSAKGGGETARLRFEDVEPSAVIAFVALFAVTGLPAFDLAVFATARGAFEFGGRSRCFHTEIIPARFRHSSQTFDAPNPTGNLL